VDTFNWWVSPTVGNASVDDPDAVAAATYFFTTNGKSFVPTFNCSICNMSKYRTTRLLVERDFIDGVLNMGGTDEGEVGGVGNDVAL
jgi:hypothetical protein